jgi:hypothetical protein
MIITSELLVGWEIPNLIPDEQLPMDVMGVFEVPIFPGAKIGLLLHEEILGRRGLVYVLARAARRGCTKTSWVHPATLRALNLCDRFANGEDIPKEELARASKDAWVVKASCASWAAASAADVSWVTTRVSARVTASASWAARMDTWAASKDAVANEEEERRSQLTDCREWLMRGNPQERVPVST